MAMALSPVGRVVHSVMSGKSNNLSTTLKHGHMTQLERVGGELRIMTHCDMNIDVLCILKLYTILSPFSFLDA